jgi:hypothetical protein
MMIVFRRCDYCHSTCPPLGCGIRYNLIEPIKGLMVANCVGTWHFSNGIESDIKVCIGFANFHHVTKKKKS